MLPYMTSLLVYFSRMAGDTPSVVASSTLASDALVSTSKAFSRAAIAAVRAASDAEFWQTI